MLSGAHVIVYSRDAEADRAFFRDVLGLPWVDAGDGWLVFALPDAEVAVHPADENAGHELYLMCDDVGAFRSAMKRRGISCTAVADRGWGLLTEVILPGGGELGVYEPRHARPPSRAARRRAASPQTSGARRGAASGRKGRAASAPRR